jgi:sulfoxide reductase heme-binding subunit YedZ
MIAATTPTDPAHQLWWLIARSSGVVALVLVTVSVGLGLTMAGRVARRPGWPRVLLAVHEQTAIAGLVAIAVHGLALLGDRWLHPGVTGILVPFALGYRAPYTGLGIIAAYLAAALGLTYYFRARIGARRWRTAHRLTIMVYIAGVIHSLGAGTDAGAAWLRLLLVVTGVPIALLLAHRLRPRRPAPRRAVSASRSTRGGSAGPAPRPAAAGSGRSAACPEGRT